MPFALLAAAQTAAPSYSSFGALGAIVAFHRRNNPIGGWLFFFMWQIFVGCGVVVMQIAQDWRVYTPAGWRGSMLYLLFMSSFAPRMIALAGVAVTCFMLVRTMDWSWVLLLRIALIVYIVFGCISAAIDLAYFPASLAMTVASLLFPIIFLTYTHRSLRFTRVFKTRDYASGAQISIG